MGLKDEIVPIRIRPGRVHGSIHYSRTGSITFIISESDFAETALPNCNHKEDTSEKSIAHIEGDKEWY
jgi:hypothetical protein